jgi:hypothetical protein
LRGGLGRRYLRIIATARRGLARSESEDGVDGGFEGTGVPLDLGQQEAPLDSGEEGDGEVVGV